MQEWKNSIKRLFPKLRESFKLEEIAAVGASKYWHTGVATGIILPIKRIVQNGQGIWQTPYAITGGGRIDEYRREAKGEIMIYPKSNYYRQHPNATQLAYLIAINPAPGLTRPFEQISDEALEGLLAHELAEVLLASKEKGFHKRMTGHGLPEYRIDRIAAKRGYKDQVLAYLKFLRQNVHKIRERPQIPTFLDNLFAIRDLVIGDDNSETPAQSITDICSKELDTRIKYLTR